MLPPRHTTSWWEAHSSLTHRERLFPLRSEEEKCFLRLLSPPSEPQANQRDSSARVVSQHCFAPPTTDIPPDRTGCLSNHILQHF